MFKNLLIKDVANAFKKLTFSSVSTPPRCTSTLHNKYSTTQTDNPTTAQTNSVINTHTTTQTDSVTATHTNTQTTEPIYRLLKNIPDGLSAKESWLESFKTDRKRGLIQLHPDVFAVFPRLDVIWSNVQWQKKYRTIDYRVVRNRAEMPGGGRKPWPQKGTGRARQGSIRSPLFKGGGKCFGPRGPRSFFFMLPFQQRLLGLTSSLSVKYHQGLLHIVEDLDLPSNKPEDLESIVEERGWGLSVLFVDNTDTMPHNISMACHHIEQYNLMPLYGLNVYSMLKHETLVITMSALEELEDKLLMHTNSVLPGNRKFEKTRGDVKWHRTVPQTVQ